MPNRTGRYTKYGILQLILSLILIHNTIGLGLPMFINATTRQYNFNIFSRPLLIFACLYPHIWKSGGTKNFFCSLRSQILFCTPHLKICGAASGHSATLKCSKCSAVHCYLFVTEIYNNFAIITVIWIKLSGFSLRPVSPRVACIFYITCGLWWEEVMEIRLGQEWKPVRVMDSGSGGNGKDHLTWEGSLL